MVKAVVGGLLAAAAVTVLAIMFFSGAFSAPGGPSATAESESQAVMVPWPELNEEAKAEALAVALADPRVQEVLAGKGYVVDEAWPDSSRPPFSVVGMNLKLDRVYPMEYDWPWPSDDGTPTYYPGPRHRVSNVRSVHVKVDVAAGKVLGMIDMPQPRPSAYQFDPNAPSRPVLSEEQKARALEMALASPYVQRFLEGRSYTVSYGPDTSSEVDPETNTYRLIGVRIGFKLDKYYYIDDVDWIRSRASGASRWGQTLQTAVADVSFLSDELTRFRPEPPIPDSERHPRIQEWLAKQRGEA